MSSIINIDTGNIEKWSIYVKNKYNNVPLLLNIKFIDIILNNKSIWTLHIDNGEYQTSEIENYDLDNSSIITRSGSNYYLGKSKDDYNIEFLSQYFNNQ